MEMQIGKALIMCFNEIFYLIVEIFIHSNIIFI